MFCTFFNTFKNYTFEFESVGVDRHHCCPMKKGFKMLPNRSSSSSFSVVFVVQHESACLTAQFGDLSRVQILVVTALWPDDWQGWRIKFHLEWVERVLATGGQEDLQKWKREHAPQIKIAHPVCDSETYYTTTYLCRCCCCSLPFVSSSWKTSPELWIEKSPEKNYLTLLLHCAQIV